MALDVLVGLLEQSFLHLIVSNKLGESVGGEIMDNHSAVSIDSPADVNTVGLGFLTLAVHVVIGSLLEKVHLASMGSTYGKVGSLYFLRGQGAAIAAVVTRSHAERYHGDTGEEY